MRYKITSKFNAVEDIRDHVHKGVDFATPKGTPLYSMKEGIVTKVTDYQGTNIGKGVLVKWNDGKVAIYGHLEKTVVNVGDKIHKGELLGYSGNTGNVAGKNGGYHLHFAIKENGQFIDPMPYNHLIQNMTQMDEPKKQFVLDNKEIFQKGMSMFQDQMSDMLINYSMLVKNFHHFF